MANAAGKKDRSLAGRVASSYVVAVTELRLDVGGSVIDSYPLKLGKVGQGESAVSGPGRYNDASRLRNSAVIQLGCEGLGFTFQRCSSARNAQLCAEFRA